MWGGGRVRNTAKKMRKKKKGKIKKKKKKKIKEVSIGLKLFTKKITNYMSPKKGKGEQ